MRAVQAVPAAPVASSLFVAGIGTQRVESGRADDDQQFDVFVGVGFFEIFESVITIPAGGVGERNGGGCGRIGQEISIPTLV